MISGLFNSRSGALEPLGEYRGHGGKSSGDGIPNSSRGDGYTIPGVPCAVGVKLDPPRPTR